MRDSSSHILDLTKHGASARVRELARELHLILDLFPDIDDAFDPDELPVSFIVRRDANSRRAAGLAAGNSAARLARRSVQQKMLEAWSRRRAGARC
jgi:hypothetical protein